MKQLKILMILIGAITFNGCTKYVNGHVELRIKRNCIFEKLTNEQKDYLGPNSTDNPIGDSIGRKIYRNQNACNQRQIRNNSLVKAHNEESEE